ncbi:Pre-mRNA cleavage complex II protein Clp1-domain-containing protein [Zychaea mexicana]|uniref:Pre-mRNA cleavage complex II protein Clp1-domain-containing protein n=1 Tax=Zychaea mexicana TaxID=64656 RepID=UPI0022FF18F6|nr:Pre-mRNA cleavage complex II protein Clp1-domain-containing protein [Zychaea mexicana]KAI9489141.1 Pre-mRNA cleavage complex II protein Clp1-domain-containing protein [Zychaea mexicana]
MQTNTSAEPPRTIELDSEHEFRFEVEFNKKVTLKLLKGTAEVFGTELAINVTYTFTGRKAAVYTWHGCTLEISFFSIEYTANETPMTSYLNTHLALQQIRENAKQTNDQGPRVLVVGPHDVGKTSLCTLLAGYALRQGQKPIYVSLDTSEGSITMPGTVSATNISTIIDVEEGFGASATTAASLGSSTMPLAYYYGYENPAENVNLFKLVTSRLAHTVKCRLAEDDESQKSGCIIDTAGLIDHVGYDLIQHIIAEFDVNENPNIQVVKLAKSGGVVERDKQFKNQLQRSKIQEYFYGTIKCDLSPYSTILNLNDVNVWRVGESMAPSSALPLGMESISTETQVVKVDSSYEMCLHSILAILNAENTTPESQLLETNVAGFIYVSDVDEERMKMTILSPAPGRLPRKHLLLGSFKWLEA